MSSLPPPLPPPPPPEESWAPPPAEEPTPAVNPPMPPDSGDVRLGRAARIALLLLLIGGAAMGGFVLLAGGDDPVAPSAATTLPVDTAALPGANTTEVATGLPGIDPTIDWRQIDPTQFAEPGDQRINDVVVFGGRLIAAGSSLTFDPPDVSIHLAAGGGPVTLQEWELSVTAVDLDAAALIAANEPENDPAPDGVRYIMVTLEVTNLSDEDTRNIWADLDAFLTTPDGSPLADRSWCGRLPEAFRSGPFDAGATHTGNTCFAMPRADGAGPMLLGLSMGGASRGERDGAIWTSGDAETWARVEDPDIAGPGIQNITHLVVSGEWVYGAGQDGRGDLDGAIWRSADGLVWDRIDAPVLAGSGDQFLTDLIELDGRLFAAGSSAVPVAAGEAIESWEEGLISYWVDRVDTGRGVLWVSDDGLGWRTVDLGAAGSGLRHINKVVAHHGRLSLIGRDVDGLLAVVSSADTETWESIDLEARDTARWSFSTAGEAGGRLHVLGTGVMSTADGTTWTMDGLGFAADVVPTSSGLLGVGRSGGLTLLGPVRIDERRPSLTVLDGDGIWHAVLDPGLVPQGATGDMAGVTTWGDRYLAVGMATADGTEDAAVWVGGGPEGSAVADLHAYETGPPDPVAAPPASPAADIIRTEGGGWQVIHRGDDLRDAELLGDVPGLGVSQIAVDPTGALWAATRGSGLYRLLDGNWQHFGRETGLPSMQITAIEIAADGTPWVGTVAGPAFFDGSVWVAPVLPETIGIPQVTSVAVRPDAIWIATLSGLARWDGSGWTAFTMSDGLPSSLVMDVLAAGDGLWALTPAGFGHWDGVGWRAFAESGFMPYYAAYPYASPLDDAIYFSPRSPEDSGGQRTDLLRLAPDGSTGALMNQYSYKAMTLAPDGTLYVGTELYGLYVIGSSTQQVASIGGVDIFRIGELWTAPNGTVWMDSSPGLFEIRAPGDVTHHTAVPGLDYPLTGGERSFSDGALIDMAFGQDGSVWVLLREQIPEWELEDEN